MKVYFIGIGGTAMGNVARLLRETGLEVTGSDGKIYPPMSTVLGEAGIRVREGFRAENLEEEKPDLVVVGNAVSRGNPEVEWLLRRRNLRYVSLPELIRSHLLEGRRPVVIAGTHGKTTTATLAATLLRANGADPGWLVGGVPVGLPGGSHLGRAGGPFVVEGDEYDSAFFDKRSKFIHYAPQVLAINAIEFDHADIFRDLAEVVRTFQHGTRIVPGDGFILLNGDDARCRELLPISWAEVVWVGEGEGNDLRVRNFREGPEGAEFRLEWKGQEWGGPVRWGLPGRFNARNAAMAALAAGLAVSPENPARLDLGAMSSFAGVKRRQEVRWQEEMLVVVEDFGHHPTAVAETLEALRARYPGRAVLACFEPRSNTSTTNLLQKEWEAAFGAAEEVWLAPVYREEAIAPGRRFDRAGMMERRRAAGQEGRAWGNFGEMEAALEDWKVEARAGRSRKLAVFFSNGAFGGVLERWVRRLEAGE